MIFPLSQPTSTYGFIMPRRPGKVKVIFFSIFFDAGLREHYIYS
jgi:hypothetical protein